MLWRMPADLSLGRIGPCPLNRKAELTPISWPLYGTKEFPPSRPARLGRQGHQDRLDIAAGHQAELGAAIMQQVELDIAAAAHQLVLALGIRPRLVHVPAHQPGIDLEERLADAAGEGEVAREVAAVEIVEEDAAHAARLAAVRQVEVFVAPLLEARIIAGVVAVAGGLQRGG